MKKITHWFVLGSMFVPFLFANSMASAADNSEPAAPVVKEDCLLKSQMRDWKSSEDFRSIVIMISPGRGYKVSFAGGECRSIKWAGLTARLESTGGGACVSIGDRMTFGRQPLPEICVISSIEKLPPPPDSPK